MERRLQTLLIRSAFLFMLCVILVAGFWFHGEFYQIGFMNLLVLGGFVTFLVIWAARLAMTGELPRGRPSGELGFTLEEGDRLLRNVAQLVVRPAEGAALSGIGRVLRARYDSGPEFGRLLIEDARRSFLGDLSEEDARRAGFGSAKELRDAGTARWHWRPSDVVTVLRVRSLGAAR